MAADTSLAELHHVIQAAFGWLDYHLHQYIVDEQYFGDPNSEFADELPPMTDERDATLRDIVDAKEIVYEYDFGDSWRHVIQIENLAVMAEPGVKYPVCTGGARSRPPEDCGGTSGYDELLEVLADPKHEEHASMKRWVGKKFAPERFDLPAVNRALQKIRSGTPRRSRVGGSRTRSYTDRTVLSVAVPGAILRSIPCLITGAFRQSSSAFPGPCGRCLVRVAASGTSESALVGRLLSAINWDWPTAWSRRCAPGVPPPG